MDSIKVEITKKQIEAIKDLADDANAMIGGADNDEYWKSHVENIDDFLKENIKTIIYFYTKG